ncbi:MAG: carbohydrate kinase (thermoresistant glucokinase family) [Flavobacteriaceae bacterium]|jgi:carbohydrate kinase (thermoresistant glucokinase family)|tara:strand:- start:888 stop:1352 length:465 start_codon:yes stop_codon:yes gene_type:complete
MGVSGCGKTTLGKALATFLERPFIEGDAFHSKANVKKMKRGIPLNDEDRVPWLLNLNKKILSLKNTDAVIACSALKQSYRSLLSQKINSEKMIWVYLYSDFDTLKKRMEKREHFMPASLLESQLEALEVPDEAIHIDATLITKKQINQIQPYLI